MIAATSEAHDVFKFTPTIKGPTLVNIRKKEEKRKERERELKEAKKIEKEKYAEARKAGQERRKVEKKVNVHCYTCKEPGFTKKKWSKRWTKEKKGEEERKTIFCN